MYTYINLKAQKSASWEKLAFMNHRLEVHLKFSSAGEVTWIQTLSLTYLPLPQLLIFGEEVSLQDTGYLQITYSKNTVCAPFFANYL